MTIFLKTLSSSDLVLNKIINLKWYCLLAVTQTMWTNENKSAKRPNLSVTLEIFLVFPRLPVLFHSCVTQLIVNPVPRFFSQFPAKTLTLSAWEEAPSRRWSEKQNHKKRMISYGRKRDSAPSSGTSFTLPGYVGAFMTKQRFFPNSLHLTSETTLKLRKCLKDRSSGVYVPNHLSLSLRP